MDRRAGHDLEGEALYHRPACQKTPPQAEEREMASNGQDRTPQQDGQNRTPTLLRLVVMPNGPQQLLIDQQP
jgi:hypothetical protein